MEFINKSYQVLLALAKREKSNYASNPPFPNIYFTDFFNPEILDKVLEEFPDLSTGNSYKINNPGQVKLASKGAQRFGENTQAFVNYLNSQPFIDFLQELTGIKEKLIPDHEFLGGGLHEIKRGGFLKLHADFNKNAKNQDRRLNVLIYLNKDWKEEYGGHFELWDAQLTKSARKITPHFNTMAIFSTTDYSYHGHPDPLNCPEDMSRKSLALYYYSNGRPAEEINSDLKKHSTIFVGRKGYNENNISEKKKVSLGNFLKKIFK
ncbi:MAG TPA: 2OG-Fe(II) oxygenase [Puia sp.]|nr:2OG-Fe(II) oxygenase [Puia sp.]